MKKTQMTNEELCLAYQAGNRQAAEQLYLANYSFIRSIALAYARRYPGLWIDADDFTQEGYIALLRAAETYSPSTNATFLTYARRIIHNAIRDVLRKALPRAEKEITHEPQEPTWGDYKNARRMQAAMNTIRNGSICRRRIHSESKQPLQNCPCGRMPGSAYATASVRTHPCPMQRLHAAII